MGKWGVLATIALSFPTAAEAGGYRAITEEIVAPTDALSAWTLWTTNEGFKSFFPWSSEKDFETNIELRPDGPFEVFFTKGPPGARGCDDCRILGYQKGRMLSFTWTNRPDMAVRPYKTNVVVTFEPLDDNATRVILVADGWGEGPDWDLAYNYFSDAWAKVLQSFKTRVEQNANAME